MQKTDNPQKKRINRWTPSEYKALITQIKTYGENWALISSKIKTKTQKQCIQKFKNSQLSAKKGNWTSPEDKILLNWVKTQGATKWTECSKQITGRCGKQCRERWVNILNPKVKKGNWSDSEQILIYDQLRNFSTSWSSMSKILKGRTENSIKNYFYSSVRRLKSNPVMHVIRAVFFLGEVQRAQIDLEGGFLREEILKLNVLSRKICLFFFGTPHEDERFYEFLSGLLFGKEKKKSRENSDLRENANLEGNYNLDYKVKNKNYLKIGYNVDNKINFGGMVNSFEDNKINFNNENSFEENQNESDLVENNLKSKENLFWNDNNLEKNNSEKVNSEFKNNFFFEKEDQEKSKNINLKIKKNLENNQNEIYQNLSTDEKISILEVLKRYTENTKKHKFSGFLDYVGENIEKEGLMNFDGTNLFFKIDKCWNCKTSKHLGNC